jgi:phosphohistidine phosphatase
MVGENQKKMQFSLKYWVNHLNSWKYLILYTMKIHLLRHGKTHQSSPTGRDFDRVLNEKGIIQCQLMGEYFDSAKVECETWCSSAKRTRGTYTEVLKKANLSKVSMREDLYLCSRDYFLDALCARSGDEDLLIIGHNFGISDLATYLTDVRVELQTGGYVCIEFEDLEWSEISRGTGTILDQYRPNVVL